LERNWLEGAAEPIYLNGHTDSIYCVQFDELVTLSKYMQSIQFNVVLDPK
jgi:hypothetical protein